MSFDPEMLPFDEESLSDEARAKWEKIKNVIPPEVLENASIMSYQLNDKAKIQRIFEQFMENEDSQAVLTKARRFGGEYMVYSMIFQSGWIAGAMDAASVITRAQMGSAFNSDDIKRILKDFPSDE